jgi:putative DNA methylase
MSGDGFRRRGQLELGRETAGEYLTPVAYLWTRTVHCKNPTCSATVPLVRQTWLCSKAGRYVALRMNAPGGEKRVRFTVVEAEHAADLGFDPASFSKGGNSACPVCGAVADADYIKAEGKASRIGHQLMAVAATRRGRQGKVYLSADEVPQAVPSTDSVLARINQLCAETGLSVPDEPIVSDAKNANFCSESCSHRARCWHC